MIMKVRFVFNEDNLIKFFIRLRRLISLLLSRIILSLFTNLVLFMVLTVPHRFAIEELDLFFFWSCKAVLMLPEAYA
jgi:hypothetical protein